MDLSQQKLNKNEWNSVEISVNPNEKEVLQLIKQFHDGGLLVIPDQNATPNVEFKKSN